MEDDNESDLDNDQEDDRLNQNNPFMSALWARDAERRAKAAGVVNDDVDMDWDYNLKEIRNQKMRAKEMGI